MYNQSTAHMTIEEVLAKHEQDRRDEEQRQEIERQRAIFMEDREANLKVAREAERIAKLPPPDSRDVAAENIIKLLGDKFTAVMDVFIGSGGDANPVLRRLLKTAEEAKIARQKAGIR